MKTSYRELDYESGRAIQELRNKICLTQAGLGEQLGVAARTVREWEAGGNYPKAEHLKALIALAIKSQVFSKGSEAEEIRALWKTTRQRWPLDEDWLSVLLSPPGSQPSDVELKALEEARSSATFPRPRAEVGSDKDHRDSALCLSEDAILLSYPPQEINLTSASTPTETYLDSKDDSKLRPEIATNLHFEEQSSREPGSETLSGADLVNISPVNTSWHDKKRRVRRKWLLISLIALVMLTIIGSAGTLFFMTRNGATTQSNKTQAYPGYLPGQGKFVFFDPLSQERGSQWRSDSSSSYGGTCEFAGGAYHVSQPPNGFFASCYTDGVFSNFAFEVQVTITQGDCGGILFRANGNGDYYDFLLCSDGRYWLYKYTNNNGSDAKLLYGGRSSVLHTGLGQQNTIALVAFGSTMTIYANGQTIAQAQDSSYTLGAIELVADPILNHVTDVAYRNARLWTL